ncbi:acyltransferase [Burkholderia dolosa]|uniref:acyltransferase family protein n=1 Tax=Burkholderia dolosa TaxID=152500 RepID=UPI001B8DFD2C|nr:acyltransferase [Burkholderia dolosa]MBR8312371.1 acyltransferase [Burkholderia dolosa]
MKAKDNNFDCIRMLAAALVIFSHQYGLMGRGEPTVFDGFSYGGLGVVIFFSLSGYLVTQSWERDPSVWRFSAKRALRIFPALICATLLMALVMGPAVTTLNYTDYFSSPEVRRFVFGTATTLNMTDTLPGVFENLHYQTVNSSLWTIPVELKCYGFVIFLGLFGVLRSRFALPLAILALLIGRFILSIPETHHPLLNFGMCFLFGMAMHVCRADIDRYRNVIAPAIGCAALVCWLLRNEYLSLVIAVPYAVVTIGRMSTPVVRRFGRLGDVSYGMYIYAFPIQQIIISVTHNSLPTLLCFLLSLAVTAAMAFVSWHLVEHPAMSMRRFFGPKQQARDSTHYQEATPTGSSI